MNDVTDLAISLAAARILVIDDNQAIHEDFRKIFGASRERSTQSAAELALFGRSSALAGAPEFQIDSAYQGQEGLALVRLAQEQGRPYAMAFVDVRMPPGWDGIETTAQIWQHDPDIQIVICTAYSDYSWSEMLAKLGRSDRLVILKKPFDTIEVVQLATALTEKWRLARQSRSTLEGLEQRVAERANELVLSSERMQASEAQYRLLFDSNPHPMWVYDRETLRFLTVNAAAIEHYGYSEEQFRAMTVLDIRQAQDAAALAKNKDVLRELGRSFGVFRHRKQDGSLIDVEISSDRIVFNGRPGRLVLAHDITERNQAAENLRRSESLKGAILESSLDCLITIDHEGKIVEFNPAAEATFELTRRQAFGKDMADLIVPPRLRNAHRRGFAHYLATGEGPVLGKRLELEALRADGTEFPIELAITALGTAAKPLFTAFIRDITARKEADGKIKRLNRVYTVLSQIDALIIRVQDREELFREASRIAVEHGEFVMAWIGVVDRQAGLIKPLGSAGDVRDFLQVARLAIAETLAGGYGLAGRAVRAMKPMISNDVHGDPQRLMKRELAERGINSVAVIPLLVGDEAVGVLALYAAEVGTFDQDEMRLLLELGGNIAFALEHMEKAAKLARVTRVNAMLSGVNGAIARIRDRQALFQEACRIAVETGGLRFAWLCIVDEREMQLKPVASAGEAEGFLEMIRNRLSLRDDAPEGHGVGARAVRERRALAVNDVQSDPNHRYKEAHARLGIRSVSALPLMVGGKAVGAIGLHSGEAGFFDDEEMKLLEEMASNVAFALEHIEKEEKVQRLTRVYAVLSGITALIVRARDRDDLFREACRIAVEDGRLPMAWIGIVDRSAMKIAVVASAGMNEGLLAAIKDRLSSSDGVPLGNNMAARAVREKKAGVSNDAQNDPKLVLSRNHVESGLRSMAMLPLIVSGEAAGVFGLYSDETGFFDEEEMKLLTELAGDIAFALEHIEKAEKLARMTRVNAMLSGINGAIVRIRDRQALFEEACRIAVEAGGLPFAWLCVVDEAEMRLRPVASAGNDDGFLETIRDRLSLRDDAPEGQGIGPNAVRQRRALALNDVEADADFRYTKAHADRGIKSVAALPLLIAGRAVGVLALYAAEVGFFDDDEMKLLSEVAGNIAFALEHIEKEEKVQRLTRVYAVMSGINSLIVHVRDRDELFREACRVAVEQGKFVMSWIGTLDPVTQDVTPVAWAGESAEELTRAKSSARDDTPRGTGAVGQSIRARRPIFNNNILTQSFGGPRLKEIVRLGFQSHITLPLYEDQAVVGTLTMYTRELNYFDEEEVRLLTELAGDISFALENISRQQKLDKLARIRAISSEINATIVRVHDREALLREICRIAVEHGKFELVWIGLLDQEKQRVQPVAWAGFSSEVANNVSWASLSRPGVTLAEIIRTRTIAVRNDIETEIPLGTLRQVAMTKGYRSSVGVPLMVDDSVVAAIVLFAPERGFFDKDELALLSEVASDISYALQAIGKQERLDYLAYYDPLTGLANRSLFLERVAQFMRSAASDGHKLALALIDLERFKNINDSLGRPAGDALLKQVAEWLTHNVKDASLLARMGADHFAVVLPEVRRDGNVAGLIDKFMAAFLNHPFLMNDAPFRVAFKMGVALFPDDGTDADTLFKNAEAALKKTKTSGDRYLFHTQKMTETVAGKLTLENQLRQALDKEEFVLHYQPKISLASGKLTGAEALIRWNDPRTGLVPPGRFIPILEETGLINEVGRWALRKAIEDYLRWRNAGLPAVRIAVNVSPLQLRNRGFISEIEQAIGIDAHAAAGLELEITESLIMEDVKRNIASLQAIQAMGITIAIDDFGTGFSSLSYLSKLPVDTLKIDRSFVIDMTAGPGGFALVSTIITLAHSLKLKVVAEGVETEEQSRLLRSLSCDEMQGYLFSKPVPGEIFETRFLAAPSAGAPESSHAIRQV